MGFDIVFTVSNAIVLSCNFSKSKLEILAFTLLDSKIRSQFKIEYGNMDKTGFKKRCFTFVDCLCKVTTSNKLLFTLGCCLIASNT